MKIPAKIEYAYKAVIELALRYRGDSPIQINTISESQNIPKKFLVQILLQLKSANIVNSSRGVAGGYSLARSPSRISLADIVKAIDEGMIASPKGGKSAKVSDADKLIFRIWEDINRDTVARLSAITFDKLIAQIKNEQLTYYI